MSTRDINSYSDSVTDAAVTADAAERAAVAEHSVERVQVGDDRELIRLLHREGDRTVEQLIDPDRYAGNPRWKTGTVSPSTIPSFIRYVEKHKEPGTEVWVDDRAYRFVAVIDDHQKSNDPLDSFDGGGWGDHRAVCQLRQTKDFETWKAFDGKLLTQGQFAELIEQQLHNIVQPAAADMLEIAQTLQGARNAAFRSGHRLNSGEVQFRYEEEVQGRAGAGGQLEIPQQIVLLLEPFEGGPSVHVAASFRWRLNDGAVTLGYRLLQLDKAVREVIDGLIDQVENELDVKVMMGTPRPARTLP